MRSILPRLLACLALFPLLASARQGDDVAAKAAAPSPEKPRKVVAIELDGSFSEDPKPENPLGPAKKNFRALLLQLRAIAADPAVAGVKLEVKGVPDFARSLDLLEALRQVKAGGKPIACYAESLSQRSLLFASIADHLMIPPSGMVELDGLAGEVMYLKDLLALLDVKMHVLHIGEFKTAFEEFALSDMSESQRKETEALLDEWWKQMLDTIAANRGLDRAKVEQAFDTALLTAAQARDAGLITDVGYSDQFDSGMKQWFGGEVEVDDSYGDSSKEDLEKALESPLAAFTLLPKLLNPPKRTLPKEPRIAIVYASGTITSGKSKSGFDGDVASMGSETIVKALDEVAADPWVKAVVLRINSPGGSALASDMIWRAVQRVKEKKPIVASMGYVAASGGYWIAMGCDEIVAQPSTVTGSIGVVGMLPDFSGVLKRFGVNVAVVGRGPHVEDQALLKNGPTEALKARVTASMRGIYDEFIRKASEGRHMNPKTLETLARGRVWTGRAAAELNLVDALGGLDEGIAAACRLAGKDVDAKTIAIAEYPEPPGLLDSIKESLEGLTTVRGQAIRMLAELGFGDVSGFVELMLRSADGGPDRIQAVMPFTMRVR